MAASISAITSGVTSASNLILVSPQNTLGYAPIPSATQTGTALPKQPALLFDCEGENTLLLESDITDHFAEDNTSLQDNIALKPETITVHGFVGELTDIPPNATLQTLQAVSTQLTTIGAYAPSLSATALNAYNEALFLYQTAANALNSISQTASTIAGTGGESVINGSGILVQSAQNRQQIMLQTFYSYWLNRTLFNVQTPWAVFQNCAIKSLRAIQDETTRMISDFEVTFKLMRFASTTSVNVATGRAATASAAQQQNGAQILTNPAPTSLSSGIAGSQ